MAEQTTFLKMTYPSDGENPFWDSYVAQMEQMDQLLFMQKVQNNLFVGNSNSVLFNSSSNLLTWSGDFFIPIFHFGFKMTVLGPSSTKTATILDGYAMIVTIPYTMTGNTTITMQVLSQLTPLNHQQWIMGWRLGNTVYFKGMAPISG